MEYETPIDQIRPINTSNKQIDPSSVMDYTEILKGMGGSQQHAHQHQHGNKNVQESNVIENEQVVFTHTQQPSQNYEQAPHVQFVQQPMYQQHPPIPQIQYNQQSPQRQQQDNEKKAPSVFSITDVESKDYIFIIVAISIVFSDGIQTNVSKVLPNMYKDGRASMIGLMFNGLIIAIALFLSRKIKINV